MKLDHGVIYKGTVYLAGEEIPHAESKELKPAEPAALPELPPLEPKKGKRHDLQR